MDSNPKDYYAILGVSKTATEGEIKKAYKKLAMKWHPDKNRDNQKVAEVKFKEISEAYQVLTDKNKRAQYDNRGKYTKFDSSDFGFAFTNARDLFKDFFNDGFFDDEDMDFFGFDKNNFNIKADDFFVNSLKRGSKGGSFSKSVSTTTKTVNGKRVSVVKTTIVNPDGTKHEEIKEETDDMGKNKNMKHITGSKARKSLFDRF